MRKSTIIIVVSLATLYIDFACLRFGWAGDTGYLLLYVAIACMAASIIGSVMWGFEGEKNMEEEKEPIDNVVDMLKDSKNEIGALVKAYEAGKMPPAELVARTFEIGKMFMGWQDEMPDDEALALIKEENKQIQAYLNKRKMQS